MTFIITIV